MTDNKREQVVPTLCGLCGQPRDPDVEPIEMDVPDVPEAITPDGQSVSLPFGHCGTKTVTACSPTCATAYAIQMDARKLMASPKGPPAKDRPDLRDEREKAEHERYLASRQIGDDVTDSTPMRRAYTDGSLRSVWGRRVA